VRFTWKNATDSLTRRDTLTISLFGALWGLMEITVGVTIKGLRIPMGGAILTAIAVMIFTTGRYFVPKPGATVMMGAVAAILKIFSIGTIIASPFLAILMEGLIGEIILTVLGTNRFSFVLTGIVLLLYSVLHPFISQGIIFGTDIYKIYLETFKRLGEVLHIPTSHLLWIIMAYAGLHLILGFIAGWMGFKLSRKVEEELLILRKQKEKVA